MNKIFIILALLTVSFVNTFAYGIVQPSDTAGQVADKHWYINKLNIPKLKIKQGKPIVVAVIDDGIRLTHNSLKDFIFQNPREIRGNFRDDDKNGFLDDYSGWDIADNDQDASVAVNNIETFYHGTYISGIITTVFKEYYGADAAKYLKILPIKVFSDNSKSNYFTDGYKGIEYALDMKADIICCAWNGGMLRTEDRKTLERAAQSGAVIIASAGNIFTENIPPPASHPAVFSVAAVDEYQHKLDISNFGMKIDISAPGVNIFGPYPKADNAWIFEKGTSPATAIITACVAILKSQSPKSTNDEILSALKNTASPIDEFNSTYAGKLGAGIPNMENALRILTDKDYKYNYFNSALSKGSIFHSAKSATGVYEIKPFGDFYGVHLLSEQFDNKAKLKIYSAKDSLVFDGLVKEMPLGVFVPGNYARVETDDKRKNNNFTLNYYVQTIDSTTLYCKGTQELKVDNGTITDGSADNNYANKCDCKWHITVAQGKRIKIRFKKIDTEPNTDFVWIFEGNSTRTEDLLAKFSGTNEPPTIITFTNDVLLWFLTDSNRTGAGWEMDYEAVD